MFFSGQHWYQSSLPKNTFIHNTDRPCSLTNIYYNVHDLDKDSQQSTATFIPCVNDGTPADLAAS